MSERNLNIQEHQQIMPLSADIHYADKKIALIGYGLTGQSCARYLLAKSAQIDVYDQSLQTDTVFNLAKQAQQASISFYQLCPSIDLGAYDLIVLSPGVNTQQAYLQKFAEAKGADKIIGDIELFAREIAYRQKQGEKSCKLIAITGSNGKSTVVDMLNQSLNAIGCKTGLGGNFGIDALSLLDETYDAIVLELSSFQLESTYSLSPDIACILNISSDHLDRHGSLEHYAAAKQRIYQHAENIVFNADDRLTYPPSNYGREQVSGFSMSHLNEQEHNWQLHNDVIYKTKEPVLSSNQLTRLNDVQKANTMVCLACIDLLGLSYSNAIPILLSYKGLPHRFESVLMNNNIHWINDSKATNPGAAIAAIKSLRKSVDALILIAGGDAKGADTTDLAKVIQAQVDHLVLLGKDARLFTHFDVPYSIVNTMHEAVAHATEIANKKINEHEAKEVGVLLSPACASIDMFKNYQDRGEQFTQSVLSRVAA